MYYEDNEDHENFIQSFEAEQKLFEKIFCVGSAFLIFCLQKVFLDEHVK